MSKRIGKSAKGEEVDFDLLETKQNMQSNKARPMEVKQREDFVHTKRRSRGRRSVMRRLKERKAAETNRAEATKSSKSKSESKPKSEPKIEKKKTSKKKTRKIVKDEKDS